MENFKDEDILVHYVRFDPNNGGFITVYRRPLASPGANPLDGAEHLFGPVLCGLYPPVREGRWVKIGEQDAPKTRFPLFLSFVGGRPPYDLPRWQLVNTEDDSVIRLGDDIPKELQNLELLAVDSADHIEERVIAGPNALSSYKWVMNNYKPPDGYFDEFPLAEL